METLMMPTENGPRKQKMERRNSAELFLSVVSDWRDNSSSNEPSPVCSRYNHETMNPLHMSVKARSEVKNSKTMRKVFEVNTSTESGYIGVYSPDARARLLQRYHEKRKRRLSRKTVRYRIRKTLANARPRIKGRFVKTETCLTAKAVEAANSLKLSRPAVKLPEYDELVNATDKEDTPNSRATSKYSVIFS